MTLLKPNEKEHNLPSNATVVSSIPVHPLRQFSLAYKNLELNICLPQNLYFLAEEVKSGVLSSNVLETVETEMELFSEFMAMTLVKTPKHSIHVEDNVHHPFLILLEELWKEFLTRYVQDNHVHVGAQTHAKNVTRVLQVYYQVQQICSKQEINVPALFNTSSSKPHVFAVFGGQGNTLDYFSELQLAWKIYSPILEDFLSITDQHLGHLLLSHVQVKDLFTHGLSIFVWLQKTVPTPPQNYLLSAPVSLPLIALTQLAWYYATVITTNLTFEEARSSLHATTGHSQGILSAVVVSSSNTKSEFIQNTLKALTLAFHIGTQATRAFPPTSISPTALQDAQAHGEREPLPMLLITLPLETVRYHVEETNRHLPSKKKIYVSLINGPKSIVVSGPPTSLHGLNLRLRKLKSPPNENMARIPSQQRQMSFSAQFLPITAPFHSPYLQPAVNEIEKWIQNEKLTWNKSELKLPVFCTNTGMDLRESTYEDLVMYLVNSICVDPVDWPKATYCTSTTHYVDYGPGGYSGVSALIYRNREGSGIQVISSTAFQPSSSGMLDRASLYDNRESSVNYGANWAMTYRPKLVRIGDKLHLDTKFSRLVGRPPLMVAGMTPTSVNEDFVSAVCNAGYHVELAGGGHFNEQMLTDKIKLIMKKTQRGDALSINIMFLNPRQWAFQYPLVQQLRKEGYPIAGVCVAAGVPSPDVAHEIIENLTAAGIQHISFKPGSTDAIKQVVQIAASHPTVPIILQWTGGRAGGHHSYEDMHTPILETYSSIRKCENLVLVAGSGFGGVSDTLPYLTGDWSLKYHCPSMPFDAVLFGSRMLVSKESKASDAVKELIVNCPGVENELEWEKTYEKPTGGILTVRSELGEPIHKVATRNVLLWKELDDTIFKLPKEKRLIALKEKKSYLIDRLNKDAHKVWFGKKADGTIADLEEMTYLEVLQRFIDLCLIKKLKKWIDLSYSLLINEFLVRVEERFTNTQLEVTSCINSDLLKSDPNELVKQFLIKFPSIETQLLTTEDVLFFISICQNPRYKPVPFIPLFDENFENWYKKDSLWQSEYLEAVPDEDPQRVCILQGPVATRHANKVNVPVKEILDTVYQGQIEAIQKSFYSDPNSVISEREYLTEFTSDQSPRTFLNIDKERNQFFLSDQLPSLKEWLNVLTIDASQWFRAILLSPHFVQGSMFCNNYLKRLFSPRVHMAVSVFKDKCILQLEKSSAPNLVMTYDENNKEISVIVTHHFEDEKKVELNLIFRYHPETAFSMIHEVMEQRNERVKQFYGALWNTYLCKEPKDTFEIKHVVDRQHIARFCKVIQNDAELFVDQKQIKLAAPMDYAIVVGWRAVIQPLFSSLIDGDLLKLVHLSNGFKVLSPEALFYSGDELCTKSRVSSIINTATGKKIEVVAAISRDGIDLVEITSSFFIRGSFDDYFRTFENIREEPIQLKISTPRNLAIFKSKTYIILDKDNDVEVGSVLSFRLSTLVHYENSRQYSSLKTTGTIDMHYADQVRTIGKIHYQCDHPISIQVSPVVAMLQRLGGVTVEQPNMFDNNKYTIQSAKFVSPVVNHAYASVSGDYNPIHTSSLFAELAGLPDTITHGMWTSALTRKYVELYAAENQPQRVVAYQVEFVDMCLPNMELETTLRHVGMQNGRKIIEVTTSSVQDQRVILRGTAQVEQARTCYVFTGQGSQEVGMGMELYNQSPVAKSIWDRADHHFKTCYGFSILEIVRTNCKSITVHFGGKRGRKIREYYKSMKIDVVDKDGKITTKSLFPTITEDTDSYTFSAPEGLLFATQFAQPALTLVEKAAFADMQSRGLVQSSCPFAGHSLGEYAALAAVADLLPVESLVDIVFYRGMTMQNAVPRDEHGKSNYSMCAVNPARVHPQFKERDLEELVAYLANETGCLLEIVNYNVESWQYVIAGDNQGLVALTEVLNAMSKGIFEKEKLEEIMRDKDIKKIPLERGHASIPLSGIDVPFHSSFLLPGVVPFRNYIMQKVSQSNVFLQKLENSYIPNLVARPFQVTLEYVDYVFEKTQSPILMELKREFPLSSVESKQKAARILLIELLAYQFASAVQWIQTQAVLFEDYKVERFIEVGPSATLTNMAERTLKLKYTAYDDARTFRRKNLSYARNKQQIYYEYNDDAASIPTISSSLRKEGTITVSPDTSTSTSTSTHSKPPNTENSSNSSPNPTVTGEAEIIPDTVIPSWLLLACLLSQKLKVPVEKLDLNKTIKDLSGGKSTMQNEIIGDLQKEIGTIPEQAEDVSVKELSTQLQIKGLGKHTSALVSKLVSSKMPGGGFNLTQIKEHLRTKYGLDLLRADAFLLLGCTMEPTNRFTTQEQAKAWLQEVAETYARLVKIEYRQKQGGKGQDAENSVSLSAGQLKILFASQRQLWTKQMQALATALQMDLNAPLQQLAHQQTLLDQLQEQLDLWLSEHGEKYAQGIRPFFNPLKARRFDSAWNWVRQDALNLFFEIIFGRLKDVDRALIAQCLHVMNRADQHVVHFMKYWLEHHHPFFVKVQPENYALVQSLGMELVGNCCEAINMNPVYKYVEYPTAPETKINEKGRLEYNEVLRPGVRKIAAYVEMMQKDQYLSVKVLDDSTQTWKLSEDLTQRYFKVLSHVTDEGLTLSNKSILMTGCGRDSIGSAILKGALSAGAKIVVTTSRFTQQITEYYRGIFERHGSRGSVLIVVPFNQGSSTDTQQLIQYIYKELEWDLDFVVPFAAISENGRELSDIDSVSELAHRIMLTNLIRLLGFVISEKKKRGIITRPAQVILPLSPNHGVFGGDGLYGESKIALECMLNRWSSESWGEYLCLVGAVIGWTRGTGLMQSNNLVAQGVEELGVYTFSQAEMAFNLLSLMHPMIVRLSQEQPLYVDLAGRMNKLPKLNEKVTELRMTLLGNSEIQQVVLQDHKYDQNAVVNPKFEPKVIPRANLRFDFPELPAFEDLHKQLGVLQGMIDLEKVVVVTGYGEVGPYGNSRTRWDMESKGQFSLEGCIEMAWMMGFIRHYQGTLEDGTKYAGWVDTETGKPVRDTEIKSKYEDRILKHTGIRLIEPELFDGYRPEHKTLLQEIIVEEDMSPIEMSKEEAIQFAKEHGNLCVLKELESGQYSVLLKKGARLYIPKALRFDRLVAGQVPKGWSARRYGIPNDIIRQVDRLTLYVLVSTVEALINSGITDPYEFYKYVHVTDVGSTSGSGVGGAQSNRKVYRDRFLDKQVQQDILQETFINTIAAWINLLLLSSSGPIKTPVGACATAVQSVELGVEAILGGKAKIVLVGGYDDFTEEGSFEFANMKATSNSDAEMAMGREPKEMCRPAASTRSGFMESHGAGMEILMNASIAIEMGVPIYGIVALTNTATDKVGRSVPAPGKGVLTTARQIPQRFPSKLLDLQYRRQQCQRQLRHISEWMEEETKQILEEAATQVDAEMREIFVRERKEAMERDAKRQTKAVLSTWSNDFYSQDPSIAPLRGALGVWGLTIDDIGLASFHGTGTKANDFNESQVLNEQFNHLGRSQGNPVPCVFQKYLTGHPKGAAASWMLNGMLQSLQTGIVPGNRNADNIDAAMQQFTNLLYPSVSITTDGIKAGLLKSFGFGQVGGEVLVIHPHFVLAVLKEHEYKAYVQRRSARQDKCYRYWHDTLTGSIDFVSVKNAPPYTKEQEVQVYLDPSMRASWDSTSRSYQFSSSTITPSLPLPTTWVTAMNVSPQTLESTEKQQKGIGIDIEHISVFNDLTSSLIERNFTKREIEYCLSRPDPSSSFAGKWAAKESVVKAISNFDLNRPKVWVQGAGAPLIDIEILISTSGAPQVFVHNLAAKACEDVGVNEVKTSISHSGEYAMALSQAF